jgi:pimeloyl-ACP methyl ester carboxylesterase
MTEMLALDWAGREVTIEYRWTDNAARNDPVMVFLHEGLGSVAMWKDFPDRLCERLGLRGLVYSRPAYGKSTPRAPDERWQPDFLERQATEVLPALLSALGITRPWLFGHSDGGSIALLYAASHPQALRGAVVVAPHIFVEDISITSIAAARQAYLHGGLRERLARHHEDVDSAFFGWNEVWLSDAFRHWNIEMQLEAIRCPLLAVQGEDDEYGTMRQITGIRDRLPSTELLALPRCRHSPHRDQPEALIDAVAAFVRSHEEAAGRRE